MNFHMLSSLTFIQLHIKHIQVHVCYNAFSDIHGSQQACPLQGIGRSCGMSTLSSTIFRPSKLTLFARPLSGMFDPHHWQLWRDWVLTCPICRAQAHIPDGGAEEFPSAFCWNTFNETVEKLEKLDLHQNPQCKLCLEDGKHSDAVSLCTDCVKTFCVVCLRYHNRLIQNHKLIGWKYKDGGTCKCCAESIWNMSKAWTNLWILLWDMFRAYLYEMHSSWTQHSYKTRSLWCC